MNKLKYVFSSLVAMFFLACSSTKVGLTENWIDERDVMALTGASVSKWMVKAGRPTIVEIVGDTSIYYYNYRPTLYASVAYTGDNAEESKPTLANATEIWGNRKNLMQMKVVRDSVISAVVVEGPDKRTFVRDLNGDLILDPKSGYTPNYSDEIKIKGDFNEYAKNYSRLNSKNGQASAVPASVVPAVPATPPDQPEPLATPEPPAQPAQPTDDGWPVIPSVP
jgi:hypothetical protein